jgi:hypothetical protein
VRQWGVWFSEDAMAVGGPRETRSSVLIVIRTRVSCMWHGGPLYHEA